LKKMAMILAGCFLFFAGHLTGNLVDNNQARALDVTTESGYLLVTTGTYNVEWNGKMVQVYSDSTDKYPAKFLRTVVGGKVKLFGLSPR
jgi:hypothetical protein